MRRLIPICWLLASSMSSFNAYADRYFTWIDEDGETRRTLIESQSEEKASSESTQRPDSPTSTPASEPGAGNGSDAEADPAPASSKENADSVVTGASVEQKALPEDEREPAEQGGQPPKEESGKTGVEPESQSTEAPGDNSEALEHPEYNLKNYPDGDELAKRGFRREGEGKPFFTWQDAEGRIRYSYYEIESQQEESGNETVAPEYLPVSPARVITRNTGTLPQGADPAVTTIMGLEEQPSELKAFSSDCCSQMDTDEALSLTMEKGQGFRLDPEKKRFGFSTGRSAYQLVDIGEVDRDRLIRIRSFIADGVFIPTVVFLDRDLHPVRMVTDLQFDYEPETLFRYGYFEARIPLRPKDKEAYLLLLTGEEDLASSTFVTGQGAIEHSAKGEIELRAIKPPQ